MILRFSVANSTINSWLSWWKKYYFLPVALILSSISVFYFTVFYLNSIGLAYNDARSHLDIGRRVVEGLKPGLAQIGSVWLPLPHLLMVPTIWNDFMWHSGLSGAVQSMFSYIATGLLIMAFLKRLRVGIFEQIIAVTLFATNLNIVYLQSTAMTELLLIATMLASAYELLRWEQEEKLVYLVRTALWVMLSTLIRYDGWFLCWHVFVLILLNNWYKYRTLYLEGLTILYCSLAGLGILLWVGWNFIIFKDPLYFALGPYSAHSQQEQIESAGQLQTKGNWLESSSIYTQATIFNIGMIPFMLGWLGTLLFLADKKYPLTTRLASTALIAPFIFNILALYLGHSVLFLQNVNSNTWFNVRYGILLLPATSIWVGYLAHRFNRLKYVILSVIILSNAFMFASIDAVTIDDATVGSSQKNVTEVSSWLQQNTADKKGFILISAASHDAIIFSSGLPMKRFIHEGTGKYWENATSGPDRWARWIIMRTNDLNDQTFRLVNESGALNKYDLVQSFPFADIYQLKSEYESNVTTEPVIGKQK